MAGSSTCCGAPSTVESTSASAEGRYLQQHQQCLRREKGGWCRIPLINVSKLVGGKQLAPTANKTHLSTEEQHDG
jgi:hypothetical protein